MHRPPPHATDEEERLSTLRRYRILDTAPEPQFDRIANLAKRWFDVPIALVAFMDSDRNFLKSHCDLPVSESPRAISFCGHAILDDDVLVVGDATLDDRFSESPLVIGAFHIRFYAGAPLITASSHRIGTLCLFDTRPRSFTNRDKADLRDLAAIIVDHLEMRRAIGNVYDDVETRRLAEAEAQRLAYHDALTGLPNRAELQRVIAGGLPFARTGILAAFAADIDDFKAVNDTLGHRAGDELLCRTAGTINAVLGERAFIARISGDEFVAIIDGDSREAVESLASAVVENTASPFPLAGHTVVNGVSIGVAFGDPHTDDIESLLRDADLQVAKQSGRRQAATFNETIALEARRRARLERDLASAIRDKEIEVYFQPIHQAPNGGMIEVEALARWRHPDFGAISPVEFVRLAEETGQILSLGDHILHTALLSALRWQGIFVSVNLSPLQFKLADLASDVALILEDVGYPASRLQFEVTEGVLLHDQLGARRQIEALQRIGAAVALDDFGTGYSSPNYLAGLPFDKIKIDRSFVKGVCDDDRRQAIVRHIVALARELNMRVTAEGVESEEEALLLTAAGCTSLQGFFFARALSAPEIGRRLRASAAA